MICMGCGRRADPNRSFCRHCGSSVFVDPGERAARSMLATVDQTVTASASESAARQAVPRQTVAQQMRSRPQRARTAGATAPSFPLGGLIKLLVFVFILWQISSPLLKIPEVRDVKESLMRGETPNVQPAIDALSAMFSSSLESPSSTTTETAVPAVETTTPPADPPAPSVPVTTGADAANQRAAASDERARVIAPAANGTEMPVVVQKVSPKYTAEAMREKIQGTVLLRALVQADGTVSNVSVVRSLDRVHGLDKEAVEALKQWVFEPVTRSGEPVRAFVQVELTFTLR